MGKHTPGPWHWVNPNSDDPRQSGEMRSSLRTVQDWPAEYAFGRRLPKWILDAEISDGDEMEANARLIAAAPDLLEALSEVVDWIVGWDPNFTLDREWPETREKIRNAIAKAKGGA